MIGVIRSVRMRILLQKKIASYPDRFKAVICHIPHSNKLDDNDEIDDIEDQKQFATIESSIEDPDSSPLDSGHRIGHEI